MARNKNTHDKTDRELQNLDPITDEKGSHPVGAGIGAAMGGAAAGAAAGSLAGPVGTVAGAVVGGIAGGYAGKALAEEINPTIETEYWREAYPLSSYFRPDRSFELYEPAFRLGWESYEESRPWESRERELQEKWEEGRWENEGGSPPLTWEEARLAARDAYERIEGRVNKPQKPR